MIQLKLGMDRCQKLDRLKIRPQILVHQLLNIQLSVYP
jgi:hypothetical protein